MTDKPVWPGDEATDAEKSQYHWDMAAWNDKQNAATPASHAAEHLTNGDDFEDPSENDKPADDDQTVELPL